MLDLVYIGITLIFFGLVLAYVRGCEVLGRASKHAGMHEESSS